MKKRLLPLLFLMPVLSAHAQVDNYCMRLAENGSVNCGAMPELDQVDNYSVQFWMNADDWTNGATVLSRGDGLKIQLGNKHCLVVSLGDQTFTVKSAKIAARKWMQFTLNVENLYVTILMNGEQVYRRRSRVGSYQLPADGDSFVLGGDLFKGRLDEVRVWNATLKPDYDYFVFNTLNKWAPQLNNLVAYYKLDQEKCPDMVDYVTLLQKRELNHHGKLSATGAQKEIVKDNELFKYLLCGSYTDNFRFFDWVIDADKYQLTNDLIILGLQSYGDGHVKPENTNDHATMVGEGYEFLDEFKGRKGVLSLTGNQYLETTADVLLPEEWRGYGYTFQTWIYLDQWSEGAFLFKKLTKNGKGISISLGNEKTGELIAMVDGKKFVSRCGLKTGRWANVAVTAQEGQTSKNTFCFYVNGEPHYAYLTDGSTNIRFQGAGQTIATIGEGLKAKLDETVVWNGCFNQEAIVQHSQKIPLPQVGKAGGGWGFQRASAFYKYDNPEKRGWDSYSQDEWREIMLKPYKGYRGYQVRISVRPHNGWQQTIGDAKKRTIFAKDLAKCSEGYDGVELDLEWMDGLQTSLGELSKEIKKYLPEDKTLMVSCHAYGAYKFPYDAMDVVDGFTFQQYGPQKRWYDLNSYTSSYNSFVNYGFPKKKIYLSYASTTSNGDGQGYHAPIGWISVADKYKFTDNMGLIGLPFKDAKYFVHSPEQVYQRAKFAREQDVEGIFYWDMGNDMPASSPLCLLRSCCYALNGNVEPLVTEVEFNYPTGISEMTVNNALQTVYNAQRDEVTVEGGFQVRSIQVFSMDGRQVAYSDGATASLAGVASGSYIVRPILENGRPAPTFVILKK